jgi:predicted amidohydrolase
MLVKNKLSIAVFQGKINLGNYELNLDKTIEQLNIAESKGIDILCMPESFLQGYYETKEDALKNSIHIR